MTTFKAFMKQVLPIVAELTNNKIDEMGVLRFKAEDVGYLFQMDYCTSMTPEASAKEFVDTLYANRY